MFTEPSRDRLREGLISAARADDRIVAAAVVGSGAFDRTDRWSDIDLALRLAQACDLGLVVEAWTAEMYSRHGALDHLDVWLGKALYRVFLLATTLQVDLSFWPYETFAATGDAFRLVFGEANQPQVPDDADTHTLVAWGWLYALHARSSIARGRHLQAGYMLDQLRADVVSLICLRHGLPAYQGRGVDDLPPDLRGLLSRTVVGSLTTPDLSRALATLVELLLHETEYLNRELSHRLDAPLRSLATY